MSTSGVEGGFTIIIITIPTNNRSIGTAMEVIVVLSHI